MTGQSAVNILKSDSAGDKTSMVRMPIRVYTGSTWRIRLNHLRAAAMRPYVKLLWPLAYFTLTTCLFYSYQPFRFNDLDSSTFEHECLCNFCIPLIIVQKAISHGLTVVITAQMTFQPSNGAYCSWSYDKTQWTYIVAGFIWRQRRLNIIHHTLVSRG